MKKHWAEQYNYEQPFSSITFSQCGCNNTDGKVFSQSTVQNGTIHQVTTMLATSKNVLFPGHTNLLTTGTDDMTL